MQIPLGKSTSSRNEKKNKCIWAREKAKNESSLLEMVFAFLAAKCAGLFLWNGLV